MELVTGGVERKVPAAVAGVEVVHGLARVVVLVGIEQPHPREGKELTGQGGVEVRRNAILDLIRDQVLLPRAPGLVFVLVVDVIVVEGFVAAVIFLFAHSIFLRKMCVGRGCCGGSARIIAAGLPYGLRRFRIGSAAGPGVAAAAGSALFQRGMYGGSRDLRT